MSKIIGGELIERLAEAEHASWARWMDYLFSRSLTCQDGSVVIPGDLVRRWQIQARTPYADLSEREKESDRAEVRLILPAITQAVSLARLEPAPEPNRCPHGHIGCCGHHDLEDMPIHAAGCQRA